MLIPNKFSGYRAGGARLYFMDGGGGDSAPAPASQTQVSDLPDWAKPYAQDTLAKGQALTATPYQQYGGERIAGFSNLQNQAFQGAQNMQAAPQLGQASGIAGLAANQALGAGSNYNPYQAQMLTAQAPGLSQYQMGPAERVRADTFGGQQAAQYMSPFIEQALAPQLRELSRQSEIQRNMDQARAVGQGAFGGSRQAIVDAERQRNLGVQQSDVLARGLQGAYEQASNQFTQDANRRLQAQQLNQQAGLTTGIQNLGSLLSTQQLGAQTGMQSQLANQQAFQNAQQLAEQSRQYGAGLGMQGLQTALQGAGQLGQLGQQQFLQNMDVNRLQQQVGAQQQAQDQAMLSQQYQDFQNQQRYPYQQLEFMSNLLRGTPMGTVNTLYQPPASPISQLAGLGTAAFGASKMFAEGGEVESTGGGLMDLAIAEMLGGAEQ